MKFSTLMTSVLIALSLLATACQTIPTTRSTALEVDQKIAERVCKLFPHQTYDSIGDTKLTQDQVRQFNAARAAYCKGTNK